MSHRFSTIYTEQTPAAFQANLTAITEDVQTICGFVSKYRECSAENKALFSELLQRIDTLSQGIVEYSATSDNASALREPPSLAASYSDVELQLEDEFDEKLFFDPALASSRDDLILCASTPSDASTFSDDMPIVHAATLERLVERLTLASHPDPGFAFTLLLTYRSFTTPIELLEALLKRFCIGALNGVLVADNHLHQAESQTALEVNEQRIRAVRLRVINSLKFWLDHFREDFSGNDPAVVELRTRLGDFVDRTLPGLQMHTAAKQLRALLDTASHIHRSNDIPTPTSPSRRRALSFPVAQVEMSTVSVLLEHDTVTPAAIAGQLTLIEYTLFAAIPANELLHKEWAKGPRERGQGAPAVAALTGRFNDVSNWVVAEVLCRHDVRGRSRVIKRFIAIARELCALNNFSGCLAIISGLSGSAVHRLRNTWRHVDNKSTSTFSDLSRIGDATGSYCYYRGLLAAAAPPGIPYLGVHLTDLVFIDEGNPDWVASPVTGKYQLINFFKRRKVAQVIGELQRYQQQPYTGIEPVPSLQQLLRSLPTISPREAHEKSLLLEPRESAKSKK